MNLHQLQIKISNSLKELFHEISCLKKSVVTRTSELINDGRDGENPFITLNDLEQSTQNIFIQQTNPGLSIPYIWYQVDATGSLVSIWINKV